MGSLRGLGLGGRYLVLERARGEPRRSPGLGRRAWRSTEGRTRRTPRSSSRPLMRTTRRPRSRRKSRGRPCRVKRPSLMVPLFGWSSTTLSLVSFASSSFRFRRSLNHLCHPNSLQALSQLVQPPPLHPPPPRLAPPPLPPHPRLHLPLRPLPLLLCLLCLGPPHPRYPFPLRPPLLGQAPKTADRRAGHRG